MKLNALLDVHVVAHEMPDEVAVLLELQAPSAPINETRPRASFQVVLDRSGSMAGAPLEGAKQALVALVRRLEPADDFGLVTFDDSAQVVVPAGPLSDKERVIAAINGVEAGGCTDLSAGLLRGLRDLRRAMGQGGTLLVISDGHVNAGIRDVDEFAGLAAKAYTDGIVTSTLGYGRGYDETLLAAIARAGTGNHVFADDPDAAGAAIAREVAGLLSKVVQAVSLTVKLEPSVDFLRLYNDLPSTQLGDAPNICVMVELGDLYADEARKVLLKLKVPAMAALGLAQVATLELAYVEVAGLVEHHASLPIAVNVVPGDEAAGRTRHPSVHAEVLFQEAQDVKRAASEAYERGDYAAGRRLMGETTHRLVASFGAAPAAARADIQAELDEVEQMDRLSVDLGVAGAPMLSKLSRESYHRGSRQRGRTPRPND